MSVKPIALSAKVGIWALLSCVAVFLFPASLGAQQAPILTTDQAGLTFFNQQIGTTSPGQLVVVSNSGNATLTITKIGISGDFIGGSNCKTVAPGSFCYVTVYFKPSTLGQRTGSVKLTDNAGNSPQSITLNGTGINTAVTLIPSTLTFSPQVMGTTSGTISANLLNTSANPITISSIVASGDYAVTNNCGSSLPTSGFGCSIMVTFKPQGSGSRPGTVTITDSGAGSPHVLNLSGTGALTGIGFNPSSLTFSAQQINTTSSSQSVTLNNTGSTTLNIINIVASGDFAQTNTCGSSLAAQASCSINVTFTPSAVGARSGRITLIDTDATNLQTISLTGKGTVPASTVTISPRAGSVTPTQDQQFQAYIKGAPSSAVTWAVDGVVGGSSSAGTISASGLYAPPSVPGTHSVTATSTANPTQSATVPIITTNYPGVFTYHNDLARTGQNLNETVLTTGNVNRAQFGKRFSYSVDGSIFAQPLYVASVNIPGQGVHNVVYVATEHDSVYAFDADGLTSTLWQVSFINPGAGVTTIPSGDIPCSDISPEYGITSTPVIDPASNTMYVVARTREVSGGVTNYVERLHALDITTGNELAGSPVVIQPTVPGGGANNDGQGNVLFNGLLENQRAGLVLSNGVVYISWGSSCDTNPFHGWMVGYSEATLQPVAVFNTTPNGEEGGIWQGGAAPAVDGNGNLFLSTGNGSFDADFDGDGRGSGLLKLSTNSGLSVADYFTPYNAYFLDGAANLDLSSGGVLLLPDQTTSPTHLLLGGGKQGTVYLVNRDNMGGFDSTGDAQIVQELEFAVGGPISAAGVVTGIWGMPAYYQNQVYYAGVADVAKAFVLNDGFLSPTPVSQSVQKFWYPGATPSISANGSTNGILWLILQQLSTAGPSILYALDAANVSSQLYNSSSTPGGGSVKFVVPTVANGKVYVGTANELDVYGLLP
jgi:hypothetical protein